MKHFYLLSICHRQACVESEEGDYAIIRNVDSYKLFRLCRTEGNINLTDYWFATVEENENQPFGYNLQHISMVNDGEDKNWWGLCQGKWVVLGFVKFRTEELALDVDEVKNYINQRAGEAGIRWFYTFDNADAILAFFTDSEDESKNIVKTISETNWNYKGNRQSVFFTQYYLIGRCKTIGTEAKRDTESILNIYDWSFWGEHATYRNKLNGLNWSSDTLNELKNKIQTYKVQKNKKMISYFQGLSQIVNVIAQYEQEILLKDLFFLFYPSIDLFKHQLEAGEKVISELEKRILGNKEDCFKLMNEKCIQTRKMELGISEFIDSTETLMRHMGQSCPDMLHDTGRQGLPYDIPIRLCLMYVSYLNVLTSILNDTLYEYRYCLTPVVYSRPTTNYIDFGLPPKSRLIKVKISRHCMFMPRSTAIILAHEVSHYVGDGVRNRKERANVYIQAVSILVVKYLVPDNILDQIEMEQEKNSGMNDYVNQLRVRIYEYFEYSLRAEIKAQGNNADKFHLGRLEATVLYKLKELLYDMDGTLKAKITKIDRKSIWNHLDGCKNVHTLRKIYALHESIFELMSSISNEKKLHEQLRSLKSALKETYTDISSVILLKLPPIDYLEALLISESYDVEPDLIETSLVNRVAMVKLVMQHIPKSNWGKLWSEISEEKLNGNQFLISLKKRTDDFLKQYNKAGVSSTGNYSSFADDDILLCDEVLDAQRKYFEKCGKSLQAQINKNENKEKVQLITKLYGQFAVYKKGNDPSAKELFQACDGIIEWYKEDIRKKRESFLNNRKRSNTVE